MKKYITAIFAGLIATVVLVAPVHADPASRVSLQVPTVRHDGSGVLIKGRVAGSARRVRIEQRIGHRWALLRRAAVHHGRYAVRVHPAARATALRAGVSGSFSSARLIRSTSTGPSDACGTQPVKPDGSYWSCTFHDDFSGTALDRTKWVPQTNFASGVQSAHACYLDDPSTINVSGGALNLSVRKVASPVSCTFGGLSGPTNYVAGSVMTYHTFSQQYGRFEARVKNTATTAPGLQETFWMWPDDRVASTTVWPYAGEMDVSETYSSYPTLSIPFLHYSADTLGSVPGLNTAWNCTAYRGVWNTYTLIWSATKIQILVNGKSCLVNTSADPAFNKPYILAFSQLLGATGNVYDGRAPLPATYSIDYVRAWK